LSFLNELKRRNVLRVGAAYVVGSWLLIQVAETIFPLFGYGDTPARMAVIVLAIAFIPSLFLSWAFEITPEGLKRDADVDRDLSITQVTGKKLDRIILVVLALALAYFAFDKFVLDPVRDAELVEETTQQTRSDVLVESYGDKSIAVLPFVNMSDDAANEYFSDGISEELLNLLAKIPELRVISRSSSFTFKGEKVDIPTVATKLNVALVLEGSVRKAGNQVRITAQLIEARSDTHLWSETYDRELDDIFAIQDEIARKVAQALRITLLGEDEARLEQVVVTEISAYDIYLQALQGLNEGGHVSLNKAVGQFQQALSLDPTFTPAQLGLINSWSDLANTGAITRQEAVNRGLPLLEAVLAKQPDNSNARIQMANFRNHQNDAAAAEAEFLSALEADPRNARGLQEFGRFLFDRGQERRGTELIEAALIIEPYNLKILWDHCQVNAFLQNTAAAIKSCNRIKEIAPDSPLGWYGKGLAYLNAGNLASAIKEFSGSIERDPDDYEMLAAMVNFWVLLGDAEEADKWQQRADAIGAGQPFPLWSRLEIYKYREQHDLARILAREVLERKLEDRHGTNYRFRHTGAFESALKGDYQEGLLPYRETFPWAFDSSLEAPDDLQTYVPDILQIAALLKLAEPMSDRPAELLAIAETRVDEQPARWGVFSPELSQAAIATIRGQNEVALEYLNRAWEKGWRIAWRRILVNDVVLSQLASEPDYQDLVTRFESDMERQREEAYALMGITK
jgi:adenylate cyclase